MDKLHIDFETRSLIDIKKVGAYAYAAHPSTEILSCAYAVNKEPVKIIPYGDKYGMTDLYPYLHEAGKGELILSAFNAFFERCIFKFVVPKVGKLRGMYPEIWKPQYWQCTMAKACQAGMTGSLDVVCQLLKLKEVKDKDGYRVMMKMTKPRKPKKAELKDLEPGQILWHESPEDFAALYKYCKQDVVVEREIDRLLPNLPKSEQALWLIDQRINDTGIAVDMPMVHKAIALMEKQKLKANKEIQRLTEFRVDAITKVAAMKKELNRIAPMGDFDCLDKSHIDEMIKDETLPAIAKEILILRRDNGKSSTAKYEAIRSREVDSRVHGLFSYHLATTGRWGSRGIQIHNLPRGNIKDIDTARFMFFCGAIWTYPAISALLSSLIRTMFISPKGYDFCSADYAAIEARVLNWLAGQWDVVKMYEDGVDTYIHMAEIIYNTKDIDSDKRFVGKQTELGSGFGMGPDRFRAQCETYGQIISEELAEKSIKAYRKSHPKVVKFWYGTERMIRNAMENKGKVYHYNKIYAKVDANFLKLKLLSGRILYYYKPHFDEENSIRFWGYDSQKHRIAEQYSYGAKFVENIVQATARDILAHAMTNLEGSKYEVVLHVHDELVAQVKEGQGDVDEYCAIVATLPEWAKGCPTKATGWIGKYYKKD